MGYEELILLDIFKPSELKACSTYRARGRGVTSQVKEEEDREQGAEGAPPAAGMDDDAAFYTGILPVKQETEVQPPLPPLPPPPPPAAPALADDGRIVEGAVRG